jgi:hypothetical protein
VIAVRRVGYQARYLDVRFVPGELVQMGVELQPLPHQLEVVTVYGKAYKPERLAYTTRFDDFYARRAKGDGHFFTREEMLEGGGGDIIQVFRRVPGLRIDGQGWSQWVSIPGCPGPYVFVDGTKVSMGIYALQDLRVTELEGVEVYKSAASVPPEASGSCGAIMIWTRGKQ